MNGLKPVVASGLVALLIALSAVALISLSGVPAVRLPSAFSNTSQGSIVERTSTVPNSQTGSSGTTTGPSRPSGGPGVLSVLMTDPPHFPSGVTAVYVYYSNLAVHDPDGWTTLKSSGTIDILGTVNFGQTLASAIVPPGSYDTVNLDVSSALINYNGVNYPAFVQGGQLSIKIEGGALVTSSQPAAAIIDISPTVVNVGSGTVPKFVLWSEERAFPVPSNQVTANLSVEGNKLSLTGVGWWDNDKTAVDASLSLSSISLSASFLGLTVSDVGSQGTSLKLVVVTAVNPLAGATGSAAVPADVTGSAMFVVLPNGSLIQFLPMIRVGLVPMLGENQSAVFDALYRAGYNLSAGGSVHLSYSGPISMSFGLMVSPSVVTSASTYWVTVIGDDTVATTQVTAR